MLELTWAVCKRRKWLLTLVFLLPFTAATSVVAFVPNLYESKATVLVERQQVPEAFVRPTVTSELEIRLRTISQEILSRARLESIINRFGLYAKLRTVEPLETVIERMRGDIRLDLRSSDPQRRGSTIAFAISYRGPDPDTVAQVANALASFYIEENLKSRERQANGTTQFLKVQLQEARARLDGQERQVSQFKRRYLGELPQQLETTLGIIDRLDAQLRLNIDSQTRHGERRDALAKRTALAAQVPDARAGSNGDDLSRAPESSSDPHARLQQELRQAQRELRQLRTLYTEQHPDVVHARIAVADIEKELRETPAPVADVAHEGVPLRPPTTNPYLLQQRQAADDLDADLRALKVEEKRLRESIATYVSRVENTPRLEQELKELSRDYESTKELYASLSKRYEEAELAESMEQRQKGEQFRILEPALASAVPTAPNRRRLTVVASVLSLGLAVAAVGLAEHIDTSFHSREALRSFTTVPVMSLPRIVLDADIRRRRWQSRFAAIGTALALMLIVGVSYLLAHGNEWLVRW